MRGLVNVWRNGSPYPCELRQLPNNHFDPDKPLLCPLCQGKLYIATETGQLGANEDKWTLLAACIPCRVAFLSNYFISKIEVKS